MRLVNLIKKNVPTQVFFCKFCKIFKNTIFKEYLRVRTSETFGENPPTVAQIFQKFLKNL